MPFNEWATPWDFYYALENRFGFTCDVCALPENTKHQNFYTPAINGLVQQWQGACWMNPPYNNVPAWVKKAWQMSQAGVLVVALIASRSSETMWWHEYVMQASEIWFVKNRLWFSKGGIKSRSNHASSVIVFEPFCSGIKKVRQINTLGRELINGKEEKLKDIPGDKMQFVVKAYEMGLKDFSPAEIERVFAGCVAPKMCETALRGLIFNGLTMEDITAVGQPLLCGGVNGRH